MGGGCRNPILTMTNKQQAIKYYKENSPVHGRSKLFKSDLKQISESGQPVSLSERLVSKRTEEVLERKIEEMLIVLQGNRVRFTYNQESVIALEHMVDQPLDPITQMPIWANMLRESKGKRLTKADYMKGAKDILRQHSLYNKETNS